MKSLARHALILWLIALAVTVCIAAVIHVSHGGVFWIAAGCDLAMFAVVFMAFRRAFDKNAGLESRLLGWPIFNTACAALGAQLVLGFALMALGAVCPVSIAVLAEVLMLGLAFAALTVRDAAREAVTDAERSMTDSTAAWKAIRARAAALAAQTDDPRLRKLAEAIRYADPMPTAMDGQIASLMEALESDPSETLISQIQQMINRRAEIAKAGKK